MTVRWLGRCELPLASTAWETRSTIIWQPDALSWIVGFLAGVAGVLALTSAKSGALVGVLISVTTVPAAANAAGGLAYWVPSEAVGSSIQAADDDLRPLPT